MLDWWFNIFDSYMARHSLFIWYNPRFMRSPTVHHLGATKGVLCYIVGTTRYGLSYGDSPEIKLVGFIDSNRQDVWMIEKVYQVIFLILVELL